MSSTCEPVRLAVVVSGWPRLSETFALNELLALERAGLLAAVFATKPGDPAPRHPGVGALHRRVTVLDPGTPAQQAEQVRHDLHGRRVTALHGYFAHRPTAVAARAAERLGVPYGFSAHALDVRRVGAAALARQAAGAAVVVACNADAARAVADAGTTPLLLRHGVDTERFRPGPGQAVPAGDHLRLLAVGRLVEKKGFDVLLDAVALLERPWRLRIVGDGPLRADLEHRAARLGLADRVALTGSLTHADLPGAYAAADVVVVPSVTDHRGDRDGLPNVVLEAMASARPVVACDTGAIGSAVHDGTTGRLVAPRDPRALAAAISGLADPARRTAYAAAGRALVDRRFALDRCTDELCRTLEQVHG